MTDLVLTVLGADRPGLVQAVAQAITAHGGNWLESRMARLAGKFAGILRVEVPPDRASALMAALGRLEGEGLRVIVEASGAAPGTVAAAAMELELLGLDRPGLVKEIAQVLAQHRINVEELSTDRSSAPMSAEMIFRARARLTVPVGVDLPAVRATLERLAGDLMVEIRLAAPPRG